MISPKFYQPEKDIVYRSQKTSPVTQIIAFIPTDESGLIFQVSGRNYNCSFHIKYDPKDLHRFTEIYPDASNLDFHQNTGFSFSNIFAFPELKQAA